MSQVTNVIFTCHVSDRDRLPLVNTFFTRGPDPENDDPDPGGHHYGPVDPLVTADDKKLPIRWYGGDKMLEVIVAIGSFNYLPLDQFLAHVQKVGGWRWPEAVQIFVKEQHDERGFSVYLIGDTTETPTFGQRDR